MAGPIQLRLPATSANLGPGFDALGLCMDFALHIEARESDTFRINATGRNADQCGDCADSLVLQTYQSVLAGQKIEARALHLHLHNEIPLGMGCGSSAAALVAGVALASHFGELHWGPQEILMEASRREGHPDNVAACVLGGLTVSCMGSHEDGTLFVDATSIAGPSAWRLLLVLPQQSLSTKAARALLPEVYSRADAIFNVQRAAMLTAAFAQGNAHLLRRAMEDRLHQPYRAAACPLLDRLLPLAGQAGILGVALSGAGPSVLLVLEGDNAVHEARSLVEKQLKLAPELASSELLFTRIGIGAVLPA